MAMCTRKNNGQRWLDATAANLIACYDKVLKTLRGEIPLPEVVEFFPTNFCTFACLYCRCNRYHGDASQFLDTTVWGRALDEFAHMGVKTVELSGGGEPLEHPHIKDILNRMAEQGFRVGLITNGYMIARKPELMDPLLRCGDWVRFSVDAVTDAVYRKIHGSGDLSYRALREVICEMVRKVKAKGEVDQRPKIGVKFVIQKLNKDQIIRAVDEALALGVHYVQFKWLEEHRYSVPSGERGGALEDLSGKLAQVPKDRLTVDVLPGYGGSSAKERCLMSVLHPVIDWDGRVYICAFFHHRRESHCIGDISHGPFFQFWGTASHRERIHAVDSRRCVPNCPVLRYSHVVEFIRKDAFRFSYI